MAPTFRTYIQKLFSNQTPKFDDSKIAILISLTIPLFFLEIWTGKLPGPFAQKVTDAYIFTEPYALQLFNFIKEGTPPLWNTTSSFGAPTTIILGTGELHPFHFFHLIFPGWLAFALGLWARLSLFLSYTYLLLRSMGVRPWISICFAYGLTFGSWYLNYSIEIIGFVMAFFPMTLYYSLKLCQSFKKSDFSLLSLSVACLILGGFPSVVLYSLIVLGFWILFNAKTFKLLALTYWAYIIGGFLVLPFIIETLHFYPNAGYSHEQRAWLFNHTPPDYVFFNLLNAAPFGGYFEYASLGQRDFFGRLLGSGPLSFPLTFLGFLFLTLYKPFRCRFSIFWGLVLVSCLILYFNVFAIKDAIKYIPILREHPLTRLQAFISIGSAILAALTAEYFFKNIYRQKTIKTMSLLFSSLFLVGYLGFFLWITRPYSLQHSAIYIALSFLAGTPFFFPNKLNLKKFQAIAIVGFLASAIFTVQTYSFYYKTDEYYPETKIIRHIKDNIFPGGRVLDINNILFSRAASAYGVPSITNHWFVNPNLRARVTNLGNQISEPGLTLDTVPNFSPPRDIESLRDLHIQFIAIPSDLNSQWLATSSKDWKLVQSDRKVSLIEVNYDEVGRAKFISRKDYKDYYQQGPDIFLTPTTSNWIEIPVRMYRGWKVVKGAKKITETSDQLIRILPSKPGETIHLTYWPTHFFQLFMIGPLLFLLTLTVLKTSTKIHREESSYV